ncbi:hypothetical protein HW932_20105 [Allochromatium humboldtianum]|uniref:Uncharacterized protein n=1 Tax=Allochromatium humboldtianum TaxID=504901 RepID=A0A850RH94_9GAMM|nr:hypothetical protein [Allochromatium humboldtianum]NVZ11556.1 hypothetical protein [Allochromatium humboldtianum]
MKQKELLELIERAIKAQEQFLTDVAQQDNPQIQMMVQVVRGRLDALKCTKDALKGNAVALKILGEGAHP